MSPRNNPGALAALSGARPVLANFGKARSAEDLAADIIDLWTAAEQALQALVGNASLTGQQLIRAARQAEIISLDQAHAVLEFLAARDRANRTSYKPTQSDGEAAVEGFRTLEAAVTGAAPAAKSAATAPAPAAYTPKPSPPAPKPPPSQPASPYAPPGSAYRQPPAYAGRKMAGPPTIEMPGAFMSEGTTTTITGNTPPGGVGRSHVEHALAAAEKRRWPSFSAPVWIGIMVVLLLLIGGGYFMFGRGPAADDNINAGIDAMKNGQMERARGEFAKAVKASPQQATPHVFLARLSRDQGDLSTARAELDSALRLEPHNALALREMGLVLFSSRQYDLARRFFVRAVQANPQDRAAQGYLGCSLMRLNRVQEGTTFINKAGNGPWTACLAPATPTTAPPPL